MLLASGNAHKAEEFSELFATEVIAISAAPEKLDVLEDGATFNENALKKAQTYFQKYGKPVMSDDSGLMVEALPGELGIHTARFGGEGLNASERNNILLERMKDIPKEHRGAYFVCVLCFYFSEKEVFFFEGRMKGSIGKALEGEQGFGYDPLFIPEGAGGSEEQGHSVATMPEWKNIHSHRAVACRHAQKFFQERNGQS